MVRCEWLAVNQENEMLAETLGRSRILSLAHLGLTVKDISTRTNCHPEYVVTVVKAAIREDGRPPNG